MNLEVSLKPAAQRTQVGALWRELEGSLPEPALFSGWDWTEAWLEQFGDLVEHEHAVVTDEGNVIALALVTFATRRHGPVRFRTAHIGTSAEPRGETVYVERNRLLTAPDRRDAVAGAIRAALIDLRRWDALRIDGFMGEDAAPLMGPGLRWEARRATCRIVDLDAAKDADVTSLFAKEIGKRVRRVERALGPLEVEWAESGAEALEQFEQLVVLHARQRRASNFLRPRVLAFHRSLIPRLIGSKRVMLVRASGPAGLIGVQYGLIDGDGVRAWQAGWVPAPDRRLSPGLVLDVLAMRAARERGLRWYDHLEGDSDHKRRLSNGSYDLVWATGHRRGSRAAALRLARTVRRATVSRR